MSIFNLNHSKPTYQIHSDRNRERERYTEQHTYSTLKLCTGKTTPILYEIKLFSCNNSKMGGHVSKSGEVEGVKRGGIRAYIGVGPDSP